MRIAAGTKAQRNDMLCLGTDPCEIWELNEAFRVSECLISSSLADRRLERNTDVQTEVANSRSSQVVVTAGELISSLTLVC